MIRDVAKQNAAFTELYDVYSHRESRLLAWKEKGGKVVGEYGADVPDEILIAADFLPVRCYGDPDLDLKYADVYLEQAFEPCARSAFEKMIDGTYDRLFDHLAISHTSDTELRIWLYLREMRRSERQMHIPPVEFVDWLLVRRRMYQEENRNVISRFKDTVEKWTGRHIEDDELREAGRICNDDHAALREIQRLRRIERPRITGSEALVIIGSSFFMDRVNHARLTREVARSAMNWPELDGPHVFVTGTAQESTDLYELIESTGAVVTGEDHDWGDRSYDCDMDLSIDPVRAIVDRYMLRQVSCRRSPVAARVAALDEGAEQSKADAVVFFMHLHDEAGSWDYPKQRESLEARGIRTVAFFRQQWPVARNEALRGKIEGFLKDLEVNKR